MKHTKAVPFAAMQGRSNLVRVDTGARVVFLDKTQQVALFATLEQRRGVMTKSRKASDLRVALTGLIDELFPAVAA